MRALLLAALLLPAFPTARADEDNEETTPVQRYLVDLKLGDSLETVRRVYPPASDWPSIEARGGITRYKVAKGTAKAYPERVETLFVGFKRERLVEIEVVYDEKRSRELTVEKLAASYSLVYGEPRRVAERFWWNDGRTVLRVFPAEVPAPKDGAAAVAWRTAVQVFEEGVFKLD